MLIIFLVIYRWIFERRLEERCLKVTPIIIKPRALSYNLEDDDGRFSSNGTRKSKSFEIRKTTIQQKTNKKEFSKKKN